MNGIHWDTSCVLAPYPPEVFSSQIASRAVAENQPLTSSTILEYEMTFALHAKEARGELGRGKASSVLDKFEDDIRRGRFTLAPLGKDIQIRAVEITRAILRKKHPSLLRTLDGLHLATALELQSTELLTADRRMATAARLLDLSVTEFP